MGDYQLAGHPARESAWRRAWRDTWTFLSTPFHGITVSLVTLAIALAALLIPDQTVMQVVAPVVALFLVVTITTIVTLCRALFMQRTEARGEAIRLLQRQIPKLTIREAQSDIMPSHSAELSLACRIRVENGSDVKAEGCVASLLDIRPFTHWLLLIEENRAASMENAFDGLPDLPFPVPLSWSIKAPDIDIPPRGEGLLDVCYHNIDRDQIWLAFPSDELRTQHILPGTDIVFSIRIDSQGCSPIYCVGRFGPINDICTITYRGSNRPDLKDYQQFVKTPRPPEWDVQSDDAE